MGKGLFHIIQKAKIKIKIYNIFINIFILNIFVINSISGNDYISEIHLVIKGIGDRNIVSNDYDGTLPSEVLVNGEQRTDCSNSKICYLNRDINNVILKFNIPIAHCWFMFNHVENIIEVDLSHFDASQVTAMFCMFQVCKDLEKVNFGNINLSSLKTVFGLFAFCANLKIVNISYIDTSHIEDFSGMFEGCQSLLYLDLSNFNAGNVNDMHNMFINCNSLIYLNLNNFKLKDESVTLNDIFNGISSNTKFCINDEKLKNKLSSYGITSDCSDICFQDNKKKDIKNKICVESCQNKKYEENNICLNECEIGSYPIFCESNDCDENQIECYNYIPEKYYFDSDSKSYKKCYETCKSCSEEGSKRQNNCIECIDGYSFLDEPLYGKNCFKKCQYYYYFDEFDESNHYKCTLREMCPDNYKLISSKKKCIDKCENDNIYRYEYNLTCYIDCPDDTIKQENTYICNKIENKEITTIIVSKPTTIILSKPTTIILSKPTTIIVSKPTTIISSKPTTIILPKTEIPEKKIISTNIDFSTYKNNIINEITYKNEIIDSQKNINIEREDEIYTFEKIRKKLIKGDYTNKINRGIDSIYPDRNFIYTVTSTKNQENNEDYNRTVIYLGQCEDELKEEYNISKNDSLYILKVDAFIDDLIIPKVEYEIFYPFNEINMTQLNLSFCKDIKINIRVPLNISKHDIDKHNSSCNLYNDICYTLKNEKGLDKPIKARRDDFIKYKLSGCEEGCEFSEYDIINNAALCSCFTKINLPILSEIKFDKKKLLSNFKNIKNIGNFEMLRCMHLLFDITNIFKNSSNYISVFLLYLNTFSIFVVVFYNQKKFKIFINKSIKANKNKKKVIKFTKKKTKISHANLVRNKNLISVVNLYRNRQKNHNYINNPINNNKKINNNKNKGILGRFNPKSRIINNKIKNEFNKFNKNNKVQNKSKQRINSHLRTKNTSTIGNLNRKKINYNYNDTEMNNLVYKEAIRIDHRTYCMYYFSLIKSKHILISTFCYFKDYNAQIIKIYMFFFTFESNFVFSAMFYSETTMNKIYLEDGVFDLTYQLPKMFYSLITSNILNILLNYLGLCENSLIAIKHNIKSKIGYKKIVSRLKIKLTLFFIINYIIILGFWIYLGCFCAVYPNTQIHLIKEVTSSFLISFITPFFINIIPGIFRIPSLDKRAKRICLYKFSKIMQ